MNQNNCANNYQGVFISVKIKKGEVGFVARKLKIRLRILIVFVLIPLMLFVSGKVGGSNAAPFEKVTLHLKWMHAFQFAGYYAASEKGYYSEEGLNVVINEVSIQSNSRSAVLSGKAQYGVSGSEILNERLSGKPFVVLAVIFQHSPVIILSRKDNNIRIPSDLIGKKIIIDSSMNASIVAMLAHEGLAESDINIVSDNWKMDDLIDRKIDAAACYITDQPNQMRLQGVNTSIINPIYYGIDFYGDCLFTTEEEIEQNPERVAAFRRASLKGWKYAMNNVEELIELILKMPGVKERGITTEHLRYEAEQMKKLIMPEFIKIGHVNPERWKHIAETYVGLGMLDSDYSLEGFVYEEDTQPIRWWMYVLLIGITGINVLAFLAWLWSKQLHKIVDQRTNDLKESEAKLLEAQKIARIGGWEMNMVSKDVYWSDECYQLFEMSKQNFEPTYDTFLDFVHPDDRKLLDQKFYEAVENKTIYEIEHRIVLSDSRIKWVNELGKCEYNKKGMPIRVFGTAQDITDRKQAETELKIALEKATESDRLKSAFLATMSHELRTPLNAIIGFSDLINDKMAVTDIVKYTKTINSSGNHLLGIVEDLFDITLIEAGEIKIIKKDVSVQEILNDAFEIIKIEQQKVKNDGVQVKLIVPEDCRNLTVYTDSSKLEQILINLLKNSLKFTHNGHIHFGYNLEKIQGNPMLKFFVEDSGIGIEEDKQELIFDVFRQVEESDTRKYGGTGIGLSICKKLTGLLDGEIWMDSEVGKGSTFFFTLPFSGKMEVIGNVQGKTEFSEEINIKEKLVLIVEDDEMSFEYLKIVIKKLGMKSIRASNGREAIKICKENKNIHMVLMDVNMPEMNGYDATKEIKKIRPALPVVIQTAYAIAGDREKAMEAGGDDYISKPINNEQLTELIKSYF